MPVSVPGEGAVGAYLARRVGREAERNRRRRVGTWGKAGIGAGIAAAAAAAAAIALVAAPAPRPAGAAGAVVQAPPVTSKLVSLAALINARTGMPIKAETPAEGNVPPSVQTFQVSRVTLAGIEAGRF